MASSLNQLRYFRELADTGNFGRAAARLHMSQPPLSRQIAALERDLGTALFIRTAKGVALTAAGNQFLSDATEILRLVAQAERNATATGRGEAGQLTMGFTMCAAYSVVPELTRRYQRAFPKVDLRIRELMPNALESDLRDGVIDIAISFPGSEGSRFKTRPLLREPLSLVLPERHPLAKSRKIAVESLAKERFLIVPRDQASSLHQSIVQCCRAAGFDPIIGLEVYRSKPSSTSLPKGSASLSCRPRCSARKSRAPCSGRSTIRRRSISCYTGRPPTKIPASPDFSRSLRGDENRDRKQCRNGS